ncbi:MAG: M16 family metallopeptidase [Gemmobacter sp.]
MIRLALAFVLLALPLRAEVPVQVVRSPGGIEAWLVAAPGIPFVAIEIQFRGGAALDPEGKEGAVNLMTGLLEEGTGDLDARAFAEAREALAATMRFDAGQDMVSVSARFLTENRDEAVALLRGALAEPAFDPEAIERVRGQVLAGIRSDSRSPGAIAGRLMAALAFPDHPYGRPTAGTETSVAALTRGDLVAAHRAALARDRVHVAVAGDIDGEGLGALLDDLLGALPETGAPLPPRAEVHLSRGILVEEFPGPQSVILFGHEGIGRDDPDFVPAFVVSEIFGGGRFSARLMREVRDRRGLTYGIGAGMQLLDGASLLTGQVQTSNATVAETIAVIRAEWERVAAEGPTEEEVAGIVTYLTGAYPLRFDGNSAIARVLVGLKSQGYDAGYIARRNDLVRAVTVEEARRAAARLFRPDRLQFVVVGSPEGLEGQ